MSFDVIVSLATTTTTSTTTTTTTSAAVTNYIARRFTCSGTSCGTDTGIDDSISLPSSTSVTLGTTFAYALDSVSFPYAYRVDSVGGSTGISCTSAANCTAACVAIGGGA